MKRLVDLKLYSYLSEEYLKELNWSSIDDVLTILKKHDVNIISFTDLNSFRSSFYRNIANKANEIKHKLKIFPGVQIAIANESQDFSILFIFEDNYNDAQYESIHNIINNYLENSKTIKLSDFVNQLCHFEFEIILDLNKSKKFITNDLKALSNKINYAICENPNQILNDVEMIINKKLKIINYDETNNWNKYHTPSTYVEWESDIKEITLKHLFDNLKTE